MLVEKQILEENMRAEHRLADKLISQTLRRRYKSRNSSQKYKKMGRWVLDWEMWGKEKENKLHNHSKPTN